MAATHLKLLILLPAFGFTLLTASLLVAYGRASGWSPERTSRVAFFGAMLVLFAIAAAGFLVVLSAS